MAYNILIVDDSATLRSVIKRTLALSGVEVGQVYEADNGQSGLNVLGGNWVDLVFADLNMPVMDGFTMIARMQAHDLMRQVPVVVVSTEGSKERLDDLLKLGVRACIRKPFTPERLSEVIHQVLQRVGV